MYLTESQASDFSAFYLDGTLMSSDYGLMDKYLSGDAQHALSAEEVGQLPNLSNLVNRREAMWKYGELDGIYFSLPLYGVGDTYYANN